MVIHFFATIWIFCFLWQNRTYLLKWAVQSKGRFAEEIDQISLGNRKLWSKLVITQNMNSRLEEKIINLEQNQTMEEQYSRRNNMELFSHPEGHIQQQHQSTTSWQWQPNIFEGKAFAQQKPTLWIKFDIKIKLLDTSRLLWLNPGVRGKHLSSQLS